MSGDQVNVVIDRGDQVACDQQASPRRESGRLLYVDTVANGTTDSLVTVLGSILYWGRMKSKRNIRK